MPRLRRPATLSFSHAVGYSELPLMPVIFTSENSSVITVLCLVDSGAAGVLLPSELADELGLILETPSTPVVGVTGVGYGWVHPLTATLPDLDGLTLSVQAVFLPQLPVALVGRSPLFQRLDVAFQHREGNIYFNPS